MYPGTHLQVNELIPSMQVAPFWHGFDAHSSMSLNRKVKLHVRIKLIMISYIRELALTNDRFLVQVYLSIQYIFNINVLFQLLRNHPNHIVSWIE